MVIKLDAPGSYIFLGSVFFNPSEFLFLNSSWCLFFLMFLGDPCPSYLCTLGFWPFLLHFRLYVSSFFLINLLVRSYIKKKKQLLSTTILQRVSKSGEWGARKSRISRHFLEKENGKNIYFFNRQYSLRFGESDWKTRTDYIYQKEKKE